jgi:hypothetical protein
MSYIVYTSSGTILTTVPTGKVNTNTTSLTLIGRDVTNYGRYYNQNLVNLLGNFASELPPKHPIAGQLWYDLDLHKLKVYDSEFRPLNSFPVTDFQPIGQDPGEFWYDTERSELNFMGEGSEGYQTITSYPRETISGWKHPPVNDPVKNNGTGTSAIVQDVTLLKAYGWTIGALSTSSFTASVKDSTSTFSLAGTSSFRVAAGLTVIGELQTTVGTFDTLTVRGSTEATSTTTGALTVQGGASVRGNLYIGGEIVANKLTVELTTVTTTVVVTDDIIETENTTTSISPTTGALIVAGGVGIGDNVYVANTATIGKDLNVVNTATIDGGLIVDGVVNLNGRVNIANTTTVSGSILPTTTELYDLGSPDLRFRTLYISSATIDFGSASLSATPTGQIEIDNLVSSGSSTFGNVTATNFSAGSVAITGNLNVVGQTKLGATTSTSFVANNITVTSNLTANGQIYSRGNITAFFGSPSDARFKENVRNIESALSKVKAINGVTYDWTQEFLDSEKEKSGIDLRKNDLGVIAQEVEAVVPEVVDTREDGFKFVKYEKLTGLLIEAIKELDTKLEDIKKQIGM